MDNEGPEKPTARTFPMKCNDALYLLYDCDDPSAEIVLFHGVVSELEEDMYKVAWMTRSGSECWPSEWLPQEQGFPKARIFSEVRFMHKEDSRSWYVQHKHITGKPRYNHFLCPIFMWL